MLDGIPARGLDATKPDAVEHLGCGSRSPWAVCQTYPQAERWALANLQRQGFTAYLPLHTVVRRDPVTRTMTRMVEAPLFTSYLFVQPGTHWAPIQHTLGVSKLLMAADQPYLCLPGVVEAVQAGEASRRSIAPASALYAPGDAVSLATEPMDGHKGVVLRVTASHATVAMLLFGALREVRVRLDALARPAA